MSADERTAFLESTMPEQMHAGRALRNGDVTPRLDTWSHGDDVTLLGAAVSCRRGGSAIRSGPVAGRERSG